MPPPYPPPRLRLASLLAAVPGELGRQTRTTPFPCIKNIIFALGRFWVLLAALGPLMATLGHS